MRLGLMGIFILIFLAPPVWGQGGRVAVLVNLERLPGMRVELAVERVVLVTEDGHQERLPLYLPKVATGLDFGQGLLAFGEVPAGRYRELRLYFSGARVEGAPVKLGAREKVLATSFEVRDGETQALFLSWEVAPSLEKGVLLPRIGLYLQKKPLPGENAWVSTEDTDTLWVIATDTNRVVYTLGICRRPRSLVRDREGGRLYVLCSGDREIRVVGLRSFRVEDVFPVPLLTAPEYLVSGPEGQALVISPEDRLIGLLDLREGRLITYKRLDYRPGEATYVSSLSRFALADPEEGRVYLLDLNLRQTARLSEIASPAGLFADTNFLYIADARGGLHLYRLPGLDYEGRVALCPEPRRVLEVERRLFVSCAGGGLEILLAGHRSVSREIRVGQGAYALAYHPLRRWLYLTLREEEAVAVVDSSRESLMGKISIGGRPFEVVVDYH